MRTNHLHYPDMWWGPDLMPIDDGLGHFVIVGTTRAGKTVDMRLMMQSVLPGLNTIRQPHLPPNGRAVVYDPKRELYPFLKGMKLAAPIYILNPFDARSHAWDIRQDITDPSIGETFVARLFPPASSHSTDKGFYDDVTREFLTSIIQVFLALYSKHWTFRHFILTAISREHANALLQQMPETRAKLANWTEPAETYQNIKQSLNRHIAPLTRLAACCDKAYQAGRRISFRHWRKNEEAILLVGNHSDYAQALRPFNRASMDILIPLTMDRDGMPADINQDRNWFFVDEWSHFPPSEAFHELFTMGAGVGCHAVIAFQSINGPYKAFGKEDTHSYLDCCHNLGIHKVYDDTARWAAGRIGRTMIERANRGESVSHDARGGQQRTSSTNFARQEDYIVPPHKLANLRLTSSREPIEAVYVSSKFDTRYLNMDPAILFEEMLIPEDKHCPAFVGRPASDQELRPFTSEELRLFQLTNTEHSDQPQRHRRKKPASPQSGGGGRLWLRDIRDPGDTCLF
jgi:type IV secretory pathway TraG/TraD family ATPase VirD4